MPKFIDMTGWIMSDHGIIDSRVTVLKLSDKKEKDGHKLWICQCNCGNIFEAGGSNLRRGSIKSCGCLNKEKASLRAQIRNKTIKPGFIDMTNWAMKEHGVPTSKLTAVKYLGNSIWECKCECGSIC